MAAAKQFPVHQSVPWAAVDAVYDGVRSAVEVAVRQALDQAMRSLVVAVGSAGSRYPVETGYCAWADYCNAVLGVPIDRNPVEPAASCGEFWVFDGLCFASERPARIERDEAGRLHNPSGQSIGYHSGWGLWHWHGVRVPRYVIENPFRIDVDAIDGESNVEIRRVMIERYRLGMTIQGARAYLRDAGAKRLDHSESHGTLWRREMPGDEPIVMVEVVNARPEPDGSFKHYFLRVPPPITTAREAVAWTFDLSAEDYAPEIQA